jgi:hypothetical protein
MKKAIVLSLVLVLTLSLSAFAADIKTTGKVWWSLEKVGNLDPTYANGFRLQFDGKLDGNSGFQFRTEGAGSGTNLTQKRANYWVNFEDLGKLTVGHQYVNYSALDVNFTKSKLSKGFTGLAFAPVLPEGAKAVVFYDPVNKDVGAQGSFNVAGATVYAGGSKKDGATDAQLALGAKYAVVPETVTVYAEWDQWGPGDANDEKYVGALFTADGFKVYGEYALDAKGFAVDSYYTVNNVELNLCYTAPQTGDGTLFLGTTMYF